MSRKEKKEKKQGNKTIRKIIITVIFLVCVCGVLKIAPNYIRNDITDRTNLIINNNNITMDLKKNVFVENEVIYIAKEDISNFFDEYIYYDEKYDKIITGSENRIASMIVGQNKMNNNGSEVVISAPVIEKENTYYIPFSELDDIYNVETKYIEETDTIIIESKNRKSIVADSNKDNVIRYKPTMLSRSIDKIERGESVTLVNDSEKDGWIQVRTQKGKLGYVKSNTLTNEIIMREPIETSKQIEGNVSMVWDYVYEYADAPSRSGKINGINVVSPTLFTLKERGKGDILENVGTSGKEYIEWAHSNGYKVWPSLSNNSMIETTFEIMNDSELRQNLINKIVSIILTYDLDGINIDFEYMYEKDKNLFSRFIIELQPRLNEIGAVLSVDVTAPDGSSEWSMCYDRHTIGKVADYIVFMAYDQNGITSPTEGTTAGCDWVEANLDKFVGTQEEVKPEKIILGIPFYTRVWEETNGTIESTAVNMKDLDDIIPSNAKKTWDEDLKQYVAEYEKNGTKYKVWIEDEKSIEAKLDLVGKYKLAGAAFWAKDREPASIWSLISNKLKIE